MLRTIFLALLLIGSNHLYTQDVDIKDSAFLTALINQGVDDNFDGIIQIEEAEAVRYLEFWGEDFHSIEGIESFVKLISLSIGSNRVIDTIDVMSLPWLEDLELRHNEALVHIEVSGHPALKSLLVSGGSTQGDISSLTKLSITDLPLIEIVFVGFLDELTDFEIRQVNKLTDLTIKNNDRLINVDLTQLNNLKTLYLGATESSLTNITFGTHSKLENYKVALGIKKELDLSPFPNLKNLELPGGSDSLRFIQIINHASIESIKMGFLFNLLKLELRNLDNLEDLRVELFNYNLRKIELDSLVKLDLFSLDYSTEVRTLEMTDILNIKRLDLWGTKIENLKLDNLPQLSQLDIDAERIQTLDLTSCTGLTSLDLDASMLEYLYCKNSSNENLNCQDCSSLVYICSDETDTFNGVNSVAHIGSFCPHTSDGFPNELTGHMYYDYGDNNCDRLAIPIPYVSLAIETADTVAGLISGNSLGEYKLLYGNEDSLLVSAAANDFNDLFYFTPDSIRLEPDSIVSRRRKNFCITAKDDISNFELVLNDVGATRPGEEASYTLLVRNMGTVIPEGKLKLIYDSDYISLADTDLTIFDTIQNFIEWEIPTLLPFEEHKYDFSFLLNSPTDSSPLNNGDTLKFEILADIGDTIFRNTLSDIVVNSFDPNDKECLQGGAIEKHDLQSHLYYKIRFENIGSANAINIIVRDTLDAERYILSSFQIVDASHKLRSTMDDNVVSFIFENIELGFRDDENDGYVIFKILARQELEIGDQINNMASIYFDYNFPIHTNLASTEIVAKEDVSQVNRIIPETLLTYPTLTASTIHLSNPNMKGYIDIIDSYGMVIKSLQINNQSLDISTLKSGMYYLRLNHKGTEYLGKVIKI